MVVGRAGLAWVQEEAAFRSSARLTGDLRRAVLARLVGPRTARTGGGPGRGSGAVATLVTSGLDALDGYVARFLPQLVLAVTVPVAVVAALAVLDPVSALLVGLTLPLVPVFMMLVGMHTRASADRQWRRLSVLSGHFLDVVQGLPTLKVFGRAKAQAETVRRVSDEHREATARVLRVAFLSALVLELVATLSVAVVAVGVGLRLLDGNLDLRTALVVLILAPEAYLPVRGGRGVVPCERGGAVGRGRRPGPRRRAGGRDRHRPGPRRAGARGAAARRHRDARGGRPGGAGRARPDPGARPDHGRDGPERSGQDHPARGAHRLPGSRRRVGARRGQRPGRRRPDRLAAKAWPGCRSGRPWSRARSPTTSGSANPTRPTRRSPTALQAMALDPVDLVAGLATTVGEQGAGLSAGQRQRVALARMLLRTRRRDCGLVLLDEPTAHLDGGTEAVVVDALRRELAGRTVLVCTHRPAPAAAADVVVGLAGLRPVAVAQ